MNCLHDEPRNRKMKNYLKVGFCPGFSEIIFLNLTSVLLISPLKEKCDLFRFHEFFVLLCALKMRNNKFAQVISRDFFASDLTKIVPE